MGSQKCIGLGTSLASPATFCTICVVKHRCWIMSKGHPSPCRWSCPNPHLHWTEWQKTSLTESLNFAVMSGSKSNIKRWTIRHFNVRAWLKHWDSIVGLIIQKHRKSICGPNYIPIISPWNAPPSSLSSKVLVRFKCQHLGLCKLSKKKVSCQWSLSLSLSLWNLHSHSKLTLPTPNGWPISLPKSK